MDKNIFQKGRKVEITKCHFSNKLPIPSFGTIHESPSNRNEMIGVYLDNKFNGIDVWFFHPTELILLPMDDDSIPEKFINEMLEIIRQEKPAEHILADLEDYLTN